MRLVDLDLAGIADACAVGDAPRFADLLAPLGVELPLALLAAYLRRFADPAVVTRIPALTDQAIRALHQAVTDPAGVAMVRSDTHVALAVRLPARVVLGIAPSPRPTHHGWATIDRWFKEPTKNQPTARRWAADPARTEDALSIPLHAPSALDALRGADTEAELFTAVLADPNDDDARLVYADTLLERGDARGELIRVQCELARGDLRDPRRRDIQARALELLTVCGPAIASSVFNVTHEVRRGLVDHVRLTAAQLARHGAALFAEHPIRRVTLSVDAVGYAQLATVVKKGFTLPRTVEQLTILGHEGAGRAPSPARLSVAAPPLRALAPDLAHLRFEHVLASPTEWAVMLEQHAHLTTLALDHCHTHPSTFAALADGALPALASLTIKSFDLANPESKPLLEHAARLAALRTLASLELSMWDQAGLPDRVIEALLLRSSLAELRVGACRLTDAAPAALADSPRSASLRLLELPAISTAALVHLLRSPHLSNLHELHLRLPRLTPSEYALLGEAIASSSLRRILLPAAPRSLRELAPAIDFVDRDPRDGNLYLIEGS